MSFISELERLKEKATADVENWAGLKAYAKATTDLQTFLINHADEIAELVKAAGKIATPGDLRHLSSAIGEIKLALAALNKEKP